MLNQLTALTRARKRVGRGGSRGGTSGKGNKGQKARSGPSLGHIFEGGQMPLTRRLPKRGFSNEAFKKRYAIISLDQLERCFDQGVSITPELLHARGLIASPRMLVKILAGTELTKKFIFQVHAYSKSAQERIEACGGEIHSLKES